ncbi:MAG TPA: cytochrome P450 [Allosphingosinicella sp.]|nr:cytochrome P450 [Allosphingosinicella sp.]
MPDGSVGIFDPSLALKADVANARDLRISGSFFDLLRSRKPAEAVTWRDVRALLLERNRRLNAPEQLRALHERMRESLLSEAGEIVDFTRLLGRTATRALLPLVIDGLGAEARAVLIADLDVKFRKLLAPSEKIPLRLGLSDLGGEWAAGRVVAHQLKRRLSGRDPPREDFAEAILTLVGRLTVARAAYLVSTLLTAISGSPGTSSACLLYELLRWPDWRDRIRAEFAALAPGELHAMPADRLPVTVRFIKETMRLWAFPLITRRVVDRDMQVGETRIAEGGTFDLSSYVMHHSELYWDDPEAFDPDRWLPSRKPPASGTYAPFGFGPRTCVGASIAFSQLILFCQLAACAFEFEVEAGRSPAIRLQGVAVPGDFVGILRPRSDSGRP